MTAFRFTQLSAVFDFMGCQHSNFETRAKVARLFEEDKPEVITGYRLDLIVKCSECGLPFEFVGLPCGYNVLSPTTNIDATELRCPIQPSTAPVEHAKTLLNG